MPKLSGFAPIREDNDIVNMDQANALIDAFSSLYEQGKQAKASFELLLEPFRRLLWWMDWEAIVWPFPEPSVFADSVLLAEGREDDVIAILYGGGDRDIYITMNHDDINPLPPPRTENGRMYFPGATYAI